MNLTRLEQSSSVWLKLQAHVNERIDTLRSQNDGELSEVVTAKLRGRIAELKQILALASQQEPVQADDDS